MSRGPLEEHKKGGDQRDHWKSPYCYGGELTGRKGGKTARLHNGQ